MAWKDVGNFFSQMGSGFVEGRNPGWGEQQLKRQQMSDLLRERLFNENIATQKMGLEQKEFNSNDAYRKYQMGQHPDGSPMTDEELAQHTSRGARSATSSTRTGGGNVAGSPDQIPAEKAMELYNTGGAIVAPTMSSMVGPTEDVGVIRGGQTSSATVPTAGQTPLDPTSGASAPSFTGPGGVLMIGGGPERLAEAAKQKEAGIESGKINAELDAKRSAMESYWQDPDGEAFRQQNPGAAGELTRHYLFNAPIHEDTLNQVQAQWAGEYAQAQKNHDTQGMKDIETRMNLFGKKPPVEHPELTPESLDMKAKDYFLRGDASFAGMGFGMSDQKTAIINAATAKYGAGNINPGGATVAYHANKLAVDNLQKQQAAIRAFSDAAGRNADMFIAAARQIPDWNSPELNKPLRLVDEKALGSKELAAFRAARLVDMNEYGRLVNQPNLNGVLTDNARREAQALSPTDSTLRQQFAVMNVLQSDAHNREAANDQETRRRMAALDVGSKSLREAGLDPETGKEASFTPADYSRGETYQSAKDQKVPVVSATPPPGIPPPPVVPRPSRAGEKMPRATGIVFYNLFGHDPIKAEAAAKQVGWDTSK